MPLKLGLELRVEFCWAKNVGTGNFKQTPEQTERHWDGCNSCPEQDSVWRGRREEPLAAVIVKAGGQFVPYLYWPLGQQFSLGFKCHSKSSPYSMKLQLLVFPLRARDWWADWLVIRPKNSGKWKPFTSSCCVLFT